MEVFGVTADKRVVPVRLPLDTVIQHGIHPYRVDLFAEHPIRLHCKNEGLLSFTPLGAVTFAYFTLGKRVVVFVGTTDGQRFVTFWGQHEAYNLQIPWTSEIKLDLSSRRFYSWYRQYLVRLATNRAMALPLADGADLVLSAGKLKLPTQVPECTRFGGRMFERLDMPISMPEDIERVFEHLGDLSPEIYGNCLRDLIRGQPHKFVSFIADSFGDEKAMRRRLEAAGAENIEIVPTGCELTATANQFMAHFFWRGTVYMLVTRDREGPDYLHVRQFSCADLVASRPGVIRASRIALYDLGKEQFRRLSDPDEGCEESHGGMRQKLIDELVARGWNFVETAFTSKLHTPFD